MRLKNNLTPAHLRCSFGACPAIHELDDGGYVIIGKKPDAELASEIANLVAEDEYAIVIRPELLSDLPAPHNT